MIVNLKIRSITCRIGRGILGFRSFESVINILKVWSNKIRRIAVAYPDQEDLVQVYKEWGDSAYLQELFKVLDSYEPDWNKEKELGSWAAEFLLDILEEEEWEEMTPEERTDRFNELLDERYEDFRSSHQFARINNINLYLQEGEDLDAVLAEGDEKVMFPKLGL